MVIVFRPALLLLLLLATATADFTIDFNGDNFKIPQMSDDGDETVDVNQMVPNLFAPTPDQKPFVPKPIADDVVAVAGQDSGGPGSWEIISQNAGVSAMHLQIRPDNKAIMFDTFVYGPSAIALPAGNCRKIPNQPDDCWAHGVEFDIDTAETRPLKLLTDPWCSSGGLSPDGTLVNVGGWFDGNRAVRYLGMCDTCDFTEFPTALAPGGRWYATQQILPNGGFVVIGGRRAFSYELVPPQGKDNPTTIPLDFLLQTTDEAENNLYPFVHLLPDGNLFVFANNRSILLNPVTGRVFKEYPVLPGGGSRNYPASGMSALLPLDLRRDSIRAVVLVCGGGSPLGMAAANKNVFLPALQSCGRIVANKPEADWETEDMPSHRTMGDMLLLPNGEVLILNGAAKGVAGWFLAREPVLEPVLYRPNEANGNRFRVLARSDIPRVYHSSSAVLPDTSVLVAGSNTNSAYNFTNVLFPTELRVERFRPPYLDPSLANLKPFILDHTSDGPIKYGGLVDIHFQLPDGTELKQEELMVTMYYPPFTTHGYSQAQRLLILRTHKVITNNDGSFTVTVATPPSPALAPPGHYVLYVVNQGVPGEGAWVQIQ